MLPHFARDMRQHLVLALVKLHSKHCVRQRFEDFGHDLYRLFLRHTTDRTQNCLYWQTLHTNTRF